MGPPIYRHSNVEVTTQPWYAQDGNDDDDDRPSSDELDSPRDDRAESGRRPGRGSPFRHRLGNHGGHLSVRNDDRDGGSGGGISSYSNLPTHMRKILKKLERYGGLQLFRFFEILFSGMSVESRAAVLQILKAGLSPIELEQFKGLEEDSRPSPRPIGTAGAGNDGNNGNARGRSGALGLSSFAASASFQPSGSVATSQSGSRLDNLGWSPERIVRSLHVRQRAHRPRSSSPSGPGLSRVGGSGGSGLSTTSPQSPPGSFSPTIRYGGDWSEPARPAGPTIFRIPLFGSPAPVSAPNSLSAALSLEDQIFGMLVEVVERAERAAALQMANLQHLQPGTGSGSGSGPGSGMGSTSSPLGTLPLALPPRTTSPVGIAAPPTPTSESPGSPTREESGTQQPLQPLQPLSPSASSASSRSASSPSAFSRPSPQSSQQQQQQQHQQYQPQPFFITRAFIPSPVSQPSPEPATHNLDSPMNNSDDDESPSGIDRIFSNTPHTEYER